MILCTLLSSTGPCIVIIIIPEWKQYVKYDYNLSIMKKISDPKLSSWFNKLNFIQK